MAKLSEVESFLKTLHLKMRIWQIRFLDDWGKNLLALAQIEITPLQRI
ncbi:MAG: hypothetical protein SGI87_05880 [Flavobacteriales bacterium]|nr:hypothetical protein [Flavobacteriales bacterium]